MLVSKRGRGSTGPISIIQIDAKRSRMFRRSHMRLQVLSLGRRLLRLLALCLDLPPGWFLDRFLKPIAILRPLHYSPKLSRPEEVKPICKPCASMLSHVRNQGLTLTLPSARHKAVPCCLPRACASPCAAKTHLLFCRTRHHHPLS